MILFLDCFCYGIWQSDSHRLQFNGNLTVTPSGNSFCEPDLLLSQSVISWGLESHIPHMVTENKTQLPSIYSLVQQYRYPPFWGCGAILCSLNWGMLIVLSFGGSYSALTEYYFWVGVTALSSGNYFTTLLF